MPGTKISLIGAGSGAFSLSLIKDICLTPNLKGSHIHFMDIDRKRLEAAYALCVRYAREMGADLKIERTLDRKKALKGSDFVINTAMISPYDTLRKGWAVAEKHGYRFGGSYHVMYDEAFWTNFYQFKFFESITEDIMRICPKAWHLLVSNPVISGITYLTRRYPETRIVGLCHGYNAIYQVADILGLEREHITFQIPGVNHFVFLTDFYYKGRDAFPILDRWIREKSEEHWKKNPGDGALSRKLVDIYRRFGVLPIGDTASWSGASWPWWYHSDDTVERKWGQEPASGWGRYFNSVNETKEKIARYADDHSVKLTSVIEPRHSMEPMIPLVEAIACDIPRVIITNIRNADEYVPGIPRDFEVEIPTLASRRGIQGIKTNGLPKGILALMMRDRIAPVELELEAYARGSRELLLQLVLTDKWTGSEKQAGEMIDEILAMPCHVEMKKHYR